MRALVEKDLIAAYERVVRPAMEIINDLQEEVMPQVFFFQMGAPGELQEMYPVDPRFVMEMHASAFKKEILTAIIKQTLGGKTDLSKPPGIPELRQALLDMGVRADLAVMVDEVWVAPQVPRSDPRYKLQPSQRQDKAEALAVFVHVREHTYGQMLRIETKDGKRHVEYRELQPHGHAIFAGAMTMQGGSVDDLPVPPETDDAPADKK